MTRRAQFERWATGLGQGAAITVFEGVAFAFFVIPLTGHDERIAMATVYVIAVGIFNLVLAALVHIAVRVRWGPPE